MADRAEMSVEKLLERIDDPYRGDPRDVGELLKRLVKRTEGLDERLKREKAAHDSRAVAVNDRIVEIEKRIEIEGDTLDQLLGLIEDRQEAELRERLGAGTATERARRQVEVLMKDGSCGTFAADDAVAEGRKLVLYRDTDPILTFDLSAVEEVNRVHE